MQRPTFADPKIEPAFKRIFGSEARKEVLVAFLDAMLALEEDHRVVNVVLLPPERRPAVAELELSIVNVECTDARGIAYVVEMQVLLVEGFDKRAVENVDKAYVNPIAHGDRYPDLGDVVGITICDFELWPDSPERKIPMLSRWHMTDPLTGSKGIGQSHLVFLELPKYDASRPPTTPVEKWAYFFREAHRLHAIPEPLAAPPFLNALEAARTEVFTVDAWEAYILAGIVLQDKRGALSIAEKRGREEGRHQGRQEAREEGRTQGLRAGIEALCAALAIDLTGAHRDQIAALDFSGLADLLAVLQRTKAWPATP